MKHGHWQKSTMTPRLIFLLLLLLHQHHKCVSTPNNGFLTDFFQRFPHLPFAQVQPQGANRAYYKTLDYMLQKRELPLTTTTSTTTTTKSTTVSYSAKDEIWFGSTPTPLYRGYVTEALKTRPPSLTFDHTNKKYNHVVTKPHSFHQYPKKLRHQKSDQYPFNQFEQKLQEPSYMTDPNNFALPHVMISAAKNPYAVNEEKTTVKPHELKSIYYAPNFDFHANLPQPFEVKALPLDYVTSTATPTAPPTYKTSVLPLLNYAPPVKNEYFHHKHGDVEPFISYDNFELHKVASPQQLDEFEELAHQARKNPSDLAFGFFELDPIIKNHGEATEEEEEEYDGAEHHHFNHEPKYVTHIPMKYPNIVHSFHDEDLDVFGLHQLSDEDIDDPWLPQGGEILDATPSPPRHEEYREYDTSSLPQYKKPAVEKKTSYQSVDSGGVQNQDYEFFVDTENSHEEYYYDYAAENYDSVVENFKAGEEESSSHSTTTSIVPPHSFEFVPSIQESTTTGPEMSVAIPKRKRIRPFFKVATTTQVPKISVIPKGKPAPFSLIANMVTTTFKPFLKPQRPKKSIAIQPTIPILNQMAQGYKSFMGEKVSDFFKGLFPADANQNAAALQKRQGERSDHLTLGRPLKVTSTSFVKKINRSMSQGGRNELSPLEQVQVLLKEARDKPLLK